MLLRHLLQLLEFAAESYEFVDRGSRSLLPQRLDVVARELSSLHVFLVLHDGLTRQRDLRSQVSGRQVGLIKERPLPAILEQLAELFGRGRVVVDTLGERLHVALLCVENAHR